MTVTGAGRGGAGDDHVLILDKLQYFPRTEHIVVGS